MPKRHSKSIGMGEGIAEVMHRRRSPRFASYSDRVIGKISDLGGVQEGNCAESKRVTLKPIGSHEGIAQVIQRRSPRFESFSWSGEIGGRSGFHTAQKANLADSKKQVSKSFLGDNMVVEMIQRRRSPRFGSNLSGEMGGRSGFHTTQKANLAESKKQESKSILADNMVVEMIQRRSPRFDSDPDGVTEERSDLGGVQVGNGAQSKTRSLKSIGAQGGVAEMIQRRRPPRFGYSSSGEMGRISGSDSIQKDNWAETKKQHSTSVLPSNAVGEMIQRRRSPRFDSNSDGEKGKSLDGTLKSIKVESKKNPTKSIQISKGIAEVSQKRRSQRYSSSLGGALEKRLDFNGACKENSGESKNHPVKPVEARKEFIEISQRRRSPRIASMSAGEKSNCDGGRKVEGLKGPTRLVTENGDKKISEQDGGCVSKQKPMSSPVVLTPKDAVEKKRKNVEVDNKEGICMGDRENMGCGGLTEWTKEQEEALRRAYLRAKPSPHFWKKVSKMVPGKSAQDCFDRVHADLATPTQPGRRLRTSRMNLSPEADFTSSISKPTQLIQPTAKRPKSGKQKSLAAQKMVRHLLRKHQNIDQRHEADLFSILETSPTALFQDSAELNTPATPDRAPDPCFLQKCSGRLSSSHRKKTFSRFKPPNQADYVSPEVLKRVKNMDLHEKYVDQLYFREAKRRTCAKNASSMHSRDSKEDALLKHVGVHAARTALLSEAKDVIGQYQHMQANSMDACEYLHIDDSCVDSAEDDGGDPT